MANGTTTSTDNVLGSPRACDNNSKVYDTRNATLPSLQASVDIIQPAKHNEVVEISKKLLLELVNVNNVKLIARYLDPVDIACLILTVDNSNICKYYNLVKNIAKIVNFINFKKHDIEKLEFKVADLTDYITNHETLYSTPNHRETLDLLVNMQVLSSNYNQYIFTPKGVAVLEQMKNILRNPAVAQDHPLLNTQNPLKINWDRLSRDFKLDNSDSSTTTYASHRVVTTNNYTEYDWYGWSSLD